jgi:hypothetical protein
MKNLSLVRCALGALLSLAISGAPLTAARSEDANKAEIEALKKSLEKYQNYEVAVRDLYLSTVACVLLSGKKIAGNVEYAKGGMGVHFPNVTMRGPPDPKRPNVLIYEPDGKKLRLVAVEWFAPLTPDTKVRPSLFGQPFLGPMEGHEPLIPKDFVHYDLHAWLFKDNPLGMFAPTNPKVTCKGYNAVLTEDGTKQMPGP